MGAVPSSHDLGKTEEHGVIRPSIGRQRCRFWCVDILLCFCNQIKPASYHLHQHRQGAAISFTMLNDRKGAVLCGRKTALALVNDGRHQEVDRHDAAHETGVTRSWVTCTQYKNLASA